MNYLLNFGQRNGKTSRKWRDPLGGAQSTCLICAEAGSCRRMSAGLRASLLAACLVVSSAHTCAGRSWNRLAIGICRCWTSRATRRCCCTESFQAYSVRRSSGSSGVFSRQWFQRLAVPDIFGNSKEILHSSSLKRCSSFQMTNSKIHCDIVDYGLSSFPSHESSGRELHIVASNCDNF